METQARAGSAPERTETAETGGPYHAKRAAVGTALRLLPVATSLRYEHYRQRRAARYPAPRKAFGVPLVRIDIRQESTRHTEALGEMTRYLGIGDYESWSEADKQAFLIRELNSSVLCCRASGSQAKKRAKCSRRAKSSPKRRAALLRPT